MLQFIFWEISWRLWLFCQLAQIEVWFPTWPLFLNNQDDKYLIQCSNVFVTGNMYSSLNVIFSFSKSIILKPKYPRSLLHFIYDCNAFAAAWVFIFAAVNVGPSLRLLSSRQTRPACCPLFSTSIISTPVGWVGRRAIGGCSSPRRWNSLRPSTIASEAEQPPVWADCGEGAERFRDFPTNCSLSTAILKKNKKNLAHRPIRVCTACI